MNNPLIQDLDPNICPECGAKLQGEETCQDFFHQMLFWEHEVAENGSVHHIMVLSYYLQHPSLYSQTGLQYARQLLRDFVIQRISPTQIRSEHKALLNSRDRKWNVTSRRDPKGSYGCPVHWKMTCRDVVDAGIQQYIASVQTWAGTIVDTLQILGPNLETRIP